MYNNFFCIEPSDINNYKRRFYASDKSLRQNGAKVVFTDYVSFLEVMFNKSPYGNGDFFYPQNFFSKGELSLFN